MIRDEQGSMTILEQILNVITHQLFIQAFLKIVNLKKTSQ
jgi:hypothetical protein